MPTTIMATSAVAANAKITDDCPMVLYQEILEASEIYGAKDPLPARLFDFIPDAEG
jgi:hypothetical protein